MVYFGGHTIRASAHDQVCAPEFQRKREEPWPTLTAFTLIFAVTLLVECALRNNSVDRETENATRTVGAVKVGYADMNDLKMYYESRGTGSRWC